MSTSVPPCRIFDTLSGNVLHLPVLTNDTLENVMWAKPRFNGFSDYFSLSNEFSDDTTQVLQKFLKFGGINKDPNQIIIMTNGLCASAAGFLAN